MIGNIKQSLVDQTPRGFLLCDGSLISRTTYAKLFAVIGTTFGVGDGSTTFKLPDYRGYFLRGWSHGAAADPDRAARTDRGDGTGGDVCGSKQLTTLGTHVHATSCIVHWGQWDLFNANCSSTSAPLSPTGETRPINISTRILIQYE